MKIVSQSGLQYETRIAHKDHPIGGSPRQVRWRAVLLHYACIQVHNKMDQSMREVVY